MMQIRKKTLDKATEQAISQAAAAGIPLAFDRYEDMSPVCRFGLMGLDCKACTQGPCRINPFEPSNGTICGRDREATVAASFLRLIADGAVVNASFAGAQSEVAPSLFDGVTLANEGNGSADRILRTAIDVAATAFQALSSATSDTHPIREIEVGLGALRPDKINILMLGSIAPAQAQRIVRELEANAKLNVVGVCGGEAAGVSVAGNYGSQEPLLVTTSVDGAVVGKACVSPGFLALAARQKVPVVEAAQFNAAALLDGADSHYRMNAGRSLATRYAPARAVVGFNTTAFKAVGAQQWEGLKSCGVKGVALIGGCNNVATTQDAATVRQAAELLKSDVMVVASGCAAVALAKAGYMDPARRDALAGEGLRSFLAGLSETVGLALPAVMHAGTCWEIPAALRLARMFQEKLQLRIAATMPELSRPAGWCSALAIAAQGVPTYVGPILPLDGGLETVEMLNDMLRPGGFVGPGQIGDPEVVVRWMLSDR